MTGWAGDTRLGHRGKPVLVRVYRDGHEVAGVRATGSRPATARRWHVGTRSGFSATITVPAGTHRICVRIALPATSLGCRTVTVPAARATAIATLAAKQVGRRYVEGGATPSGFDCSGLVTWTYQHAAGITLPHDAQAQYAKTRKIPASHARRGDLVFFHDRSGHVYHVGIYAGGHMMWAAATPHDGVRYQSIWSSAVSYGTVLHG